MIPGELFTLPGSLLLNEGRPTITLAVANTGDRPIQVGSHFHFFETNRALSFDRDKTRGFRLDIPAGTAVRFEPGQSRDVTLVAYAGSRTVWGFNGLINGSLDGNVSGAGLRAGDSGNAGTEAGVPEIPGRKGRG